MSRVDEGDTQERVLVLAPVGRDARLTCDALGEHGIAARACAGIEELCTEIARGAGAAFITKESLADDGAQPLLAQTLAAQPAWSDLPLIVLTRGGAGGNAALLSSLAGLGNVTLIERPARVVTIVSVVRSALRARRRQYEVRDHLDALARAKNERELLLRSEQAARLNAENANRLKDEFLATVSHELRTPLTAIIGWTRLLQRGLPDEKVAEHALEVIERNGAAQLHLIEDLLDVSRIISGKLLLDVRPVSPSEIIESALDAARPSAEAKGVELRTVIDPAAEHIYGDADRLQQIVWNLVNNAVKFTPAGGSVEVRAAREGERVEIAVADTGEGVEPEFLPYVFERFRQADSTTTRAYGGLGLGLAIVRQLVELHGGTVSVASEGRGRGTTFTVALPTARPPSRGEASAQEPDAPTVETPDDVPECETLGGLRVLVVDDDDDSRELFARMLSDCGAQTLTASSSAEALDTLARSRPDVLLADIAMPGEDGYVLIGRVRALPPEGGGLTPAAALTAYARPEDRAKALRAGFQIHLPKPVTAAELIRVVASLAPRVGVT